MNNVKLPQLAWYGIKELVLPLPDSWKVETHNMAGYNLPALTPDQIETAVADTIGTPSIREFARGKQQVVWQPCHGSASATSGVAALRCPPAR